MKTPFDSDAELARGRVDIGDSLEPPPDYGIFAIRWPMQSLDAPAKLQAVRLLLWTCMDRRVLRPLYENALAGGYRPGEVFLLSLAGGPVQTPERFDTLRDLFERIQTQLPNLEKIWAVAHTAVCAGLQSFCGGKPMVDALKPQVRDQAAARGIDPELYATQLLLPGAYSILPEAWWKLAEFTVAQPDEATRTVRLFSRWVTPDEARFLRDVTDR